jgi:hypothetical protein
MAGLGVNNVTREGCPKASSPRTTVSNSKRSPRASGSTSSATTRCFPSHDRSTNRHRPGSGVWLDWEKSR